jgi:hypothetical protein
MNLRTLFTLYSFGFDNFGRWSDHHKAMHAKQPLGCAEFGAEWLGLWDALGRLLGATCSADATLANGDYGPIAEMAKRSTVGEALCAVAAECMLRRIRRGCSVRITLLDGTIVKEWGAT